MRILVIRLLVVSGLSFILILQGCSAAKLTLTAQNNSFPISFSEGIFGYNNELILRENYEIVHHFKMEKSHFTWNAWNALQDKPKRVDLSNEFDELLSSYNGEAIVNLRIKTEDNLGVGIVSLLTSFPTLGLLAPHYLETSIEGDVIRLTSTMTPRHND